MKTDCSQKQLLNRIDQVSFAVNDMTLYLDTHPCDEKALTYCHELVQERKKLLKEYARSAAWCAGGFSTVPCAGKGRSVQIIYVEL